MEQHFAEHEPFLSVSNRPAGPRPAHVARRARYSAATNAGKRQLTTGPPLPPPPLQQVRTHFQLPGDLADPPAALNLPGVHSAVPTPWERCPQSPES